MSQTLIAMSPMSTRNTPMIPGMVTIQPTINQGNKSYQNRNSSNRYRNSRRTVHETHNSPYSPLSKDEKRRSLEVIPVAAAQRTVPIKEHYLVIKEKDMLK